MTGSHLSLILLPTLRCNADCDYCFEAKTNDSLTLDRLALLLEKILVYMDERSIQDLTIYWQGGEVMMLPPEWYEQANAFAQYAVGKTVEEIKGIALDEEGRAAESELTSSVTIHVGPFITIIEKALQAVQ